jgi:hypothetical protein
LDHFATSRPQTTRPLSPLARMASPAVVGVPNAPACIHEQHDAGADDVESVRALEVDHLAGQNGAANKWTTGDSCRPMSDERAREKTRRLACKAAAKLVASRPKGAPMLIA